jgi:biotin carboxylase
MADKPVIDEKYSNGLIRLPKGYIMPSKYLDLFYEKRFKNFEALAKGIGLKNGNWSVECVCRDNDFYVFEMQFRLGGMRHYTFVQAENGIDTLAMHIRFALTGKFEGYDLSKMDSPYYKKVYCSLNMLLKDGAITEIEGLDILNQLPEVKSYLPMHQIGDRVELSGTVLQIFIKASIVAESYDDLRKVLRTIQDTVIVKDENGENMMLKILDN